MGRRAWSLPRAASADSWKAAGTRWHLSGAPEDWQTLETQGWESLGLQGDKSRRRLHGGNPRESGRKGVLLSQTTEALALDSVGTRKPWGVRDTGKAVVGKVCLAASWEKGRPGAGETLRKLLQHHPGF